MVDSREACNTPDQALGGVAAETQGGSGDDVGNTANCSASPRRLVLDRGAPLKSAQAFVEQYYCRGNVRTLHHHKGSFFAWNGSYYLERPEVELRAELYRFLD